MIKRKQKKEKKYIKRNKKKTCRFFSSGKEVSRSTTIYAEQGVCLCCERIVHIINSDTITVGFILIFYCKVRQARFWYLIRDVGGDELGWHEISDNSRDMEGSRLCCRPCQTSCSSTDLRFIGSLANTRTGNCVFL